MSGLLGIVDGLCHIFIFIFRLLFASMLYAVHHTCTHSFINVYCHSRTRTIASISLAGNARKERKKINCKRKTTFGFSATARSRERVVFRRKVEPECEDDDEKMRVYDAYLETE